MHSVIAVMIMATALAAIPVSGSSAATPTSAIAWTHPIERSGLLTVGPSGDVVVELATSSAATEAARAIDRSGALRWRLVYTPPLTISGRNTIYDAVGNLYWLESGSSGVRIASRNNGGVERWNVPSRASVGRPDLVFGVDGLLYTVEQVDLSTIPTLTSRSATSGQIVKQTPLPSVRRDFFPSLFAYTGGLAVGDLNGVTFLKYSGELIARYDIPVPSSISSYGFYGANHRGEVFAYRGGCSAFDPNGCGVAVAKVTTAGVAWIHEFPRGASPNPEVTPLPDGGVAVADYQRVTTLNGADGSVRWTWQVPPKQPGSSPYPLKNEIGLFQPHADAAGHVVVTRQATVSCGDRITCSTVAVDLLDGTTGAVVAQVMRPPVFDRPGYFQMGTTTDNGRAYVNIATYNPQANPSNEYALYAFDLPGAAAAYPSIIGTPGGGGGPTPATPTLTLSPKLGTATVGSSYAVTATLLNGTVQVANADIEFRVPQGPCAGLPGTIQTVRTSASGTASFSYSCGLVGTDTLQASTVASGSYLSDTATVSWERRAGFKYVALGDSFSAGEGVEPFFEGTRQQCHRSELAYSTLVRPPGFNKPLFQLRSDDRSGVEWGFQACSGALTTHVLNDTPGWPDRLAQLNTQRPNDPNPHDLPVDTATSLVTITIGGNDAGFREALIDCFRWSDCQTRRTAGSPTYEAELEARVESIRNGLRNTYSRILAQAPNSQILVLGYPQLFPASIDEQNCGKLRQRTVRFPTFAGGRIRINFVSVGYSPGEQRMFIGLDDRINRVMAEEVGRLNSARLRFVSVASHFAGHEVCGGQGEWINGPTLARPPLDSPRDAINDQSFHPNSFGQIAYGQCVNRFLLDPTRDCKDVQLGY